MIGLALAACDKTVQLGYERDLRPATKHHEPWVKRVTDQLLAAYRALESELSRPPLAYASGTINQAGVSVAVAWHFTQKSLAEYVDSDAYPALREFSSRAEQLPEFRAAPHGASTYHA